MEYSPFILGVKHSIMETPGTEKRRKPKCQTILKEYKRETSKKVQCLCHILDVFPFVVSLNASTICETGRRWGLETSRERSVSLSTFPKSDTSELICHC